jgi:hypothetical protein
MNGRSLRSCALRLRAPFVITITTAFASLAGCGGSSKSDAQSTGGASGSGNVSGSAGSSGSSGSGGSGGSGGAACEGVAACCDTQGNPVAPICPGGGPPQCPLGTSVPPSGVCTPGCSPEQPCGAGEYCDYPDDLCGAGSSGTCTPKPEGCDLLYAPVCGCDGQVHGNDCAARSGGTDVSAAGGCTAPQGQFGCGSLFCALESQYCLRAVSDVGGLPDEYQCKSLPSGCGNPPTCACMSGELCADWCGISLQGAITLTCPGG